MLECLAAILSVLKVTLTMLEVVSVDRRLRSVSQRGWTDCHWVAQRQRRGVRRRLHEACMISAGHELHLLALRRFFIEGLCTYTTMKAVVAVNGLRQRIVIATAADNGLVLLVLHKLLLEITWS